MTRLQLSEQAAKKLGYEPDPEKQAQKEKERAEREAAAKAVREEKERERARAKERTVKEQDALEAADTSLGEALTIYCEVAKAINTKIVARAHQRMLDLSLKAREAHEAYERARAKSVEADDVLALVRAECAYLDALATKKLPEAQAKLREAWNANDAAWKSAPTAYRKKNRDRALKNTVKDMLGVKKNGDD